MTTDRIAQAPAPTTPDDELAVRIEEEVDRLRKKRPHLQARIDRAANILVTHLACPRQRPIRVRVRQGRPRVLVNGSGGSVYAVDPRTWDCSCPDHHRRDGICKHGIAVYVLVRASRPRPAPQLLGCTSCSKVLPASELIEVTHEDESLTWFPGDLLCKVCIVTMCGIS